MQRLTAAVLTAATATAFVATPALGFPVQGRYVDTPFCDNHGPHIMVDELGTGPFFQEFPDELIAIDFTTTSLRACPAPPDNDPFNDWLIFAVNTTGRPLPLNFIGGPDAPFEKLFFVADALDDQAGVGSIPVGNEDGIAEDFAAGGIFGESFVVDSYGLNRPLISQSFAVDNLWDVGEAIEFILNDFGFPGSGLIPDFSSPHFAGASAGAAPSNASLVIGVQIPEPATFGLLGAGVALAARRRR